MSAAPRRFNDGFNPMIKMMSKYALFAAIVALSRMVPGQMANSD
jgi:hypothetical protein